MEATEDRIYPFLFCRNQRILIVDEVNDKLRRVQYKFPSEKSKILRAEPSYQNLECEPSKRGFWHRLLVYMVDSCSCESM
jgi:hypothetical protein